MKKKKRILLLSLLFIFFLVSAMLLLRQPSSEEESVKLSICMESEWEVPVQNMLNIYNDYYDTDVQFEVTVLPDEPMERESVCKKLQTELMSGKGKDIYLISEYTRYHQSFVPLFEDPNKLIYNGVLADVSPWTENDPSFQECFAPVMEAGQADGKQYLLPITFEVPALTGERESEETVFQEETKQPLGTLIAQDAGLLKRTEPYTFTNEIRDWLGDCIDYKRQKVTVSEEEIETVLRYEVKRIAEGKTFSAENLSYAYGTPQDNEESGKQYQYVPMPTLSGHPMAKIFNYIAIARNCEDKEAAYRFARLFWQKGFASGEGISLKMRNGKAYTAAENAIHVLRGVPVQPSAWEKWALGKYRNFDQMENTAEQIANAGAYGEMLAGIETARFVNGLDEIGNDVSRLFLDTDGYTFRVDFPDIEERIEAAAKQIYRNAYYIAME